MPLCNLCQSSDLVNIPQLLTLSSSYPVPNKFFPSLIRIGKTRAQQANVSQPQEEDDAPLGYPFHQSVEALKTAVEATDCSICKVVEIDVLQFQAEWIEAQRDEACGSRTLKGPDWKMCVAKGANDISGFMVVCEDVANANCVWVLSAVGLCVDGECFQ
jgi:hypothetical protein